MSDAKRLAALLAVALLAGLAAPGADAAKKRATKGKPPVATTATACSDFYSYANGAWLKANALAPGEGLRSALGQLDERARQQQMALLEQARDAPQGHVQKLLGDFWASGLDEAAIERDGAHPIAPLLARIDAIRKSGDVAASIAALHQIGLPVAFNFNADIDLDDLHRHIGYFSQGGLGLPDPAYYTRGDAETRALLGRYARYVEQILVLAGTPSDQAAGDAQQVIDLETRIAIVSRPLAALRDPRANHAPVPVTRLAKTYRKLQLAGFLKTQGVKDDSVSIANPPLFAQLDKLVGTLKPAQWKAYLRWRVGDAMAPYLSRPWRDARFAFRDRLLAGRKTLPERRQAVLDAINLTAGPMLGREFAGRYLDDPTRAGAEEIVTSVRAAMAQAVESDPRFGEPARSEARAKLAALKVEIGLPHRDLDYSIQPMGRDSFGGNMLIASTWRHREEMRRIGRGNADRRWDVLPQQPALTYDIAQNRLIVTAAMLQAPVLDPGGDLASRYGAFGALVGRELNHALDNKGRYVDARGELRDWWGASETSAWSGLEARVGAQYSGYPYPSLDDRKLDGVRVREVAIADQAGIELAWAALLRAQPDAGKPAKQAFYTGWARLWPQQQGRDVAAAWAAQSAYAPGKWRSNGPLVNQPGFGEAFGCNATTAMQTRPDQRIAVWPAAAP